MSRGNPDRASDSHLPFLRLEEKRQGQVFLFFVGSCVLGLTGFGVSHFVEGRPLHGLLNLLAASFFSTLLLVVSRSRRVRGAHRTFIILVLALFLFWVHVGGTTEQPAAAMWIYIFPLLSLFLLGNREGLLWTSILILGILIVFFLPEQMQRFRYSTDFEIRYLGSLLLVTILAYNYEAIRAAYWKRILQHHDNLEALVAQRTSELERTNAELRESEHRYRLVSDNASDLIWTTDHSLRLNFVSPSVEAMCGYGVQEAIDLPLSEWFAPESYRTLCRVHEKLFQTATSGAEDSITLELEQRRKSGASFPVELKLSPLRDHSGSPVGLLGISRDMTERKERQELLIQTEKMMSISGLAAGMVHEINNPLSSSLHSIQLVRRRFLIDSPENRSIASACGTSIEAITQYLEQRKVTKMLDIAADSTERLSSIVKTMLGFSRQSDKAFSLHDIGEILDSTLILASTDFELNNAIDFSKIEIKKSYQDQIPRVACDPVTLQQVFFNLLKNGAESMQEKSYTVQRPRFCLGVSEQSGSVKVEIEDNGPGMDPETKRRIFEPFFTTKSAGKGTGLGLSVSYFIITENHRGQMTLETQEDKGTKFIITLPKARRTPLDIEPMDTPRYF